MRIRHRLFAAIMLCLPLSSVQAHHFWLQPSATVLSKAAYITVDAAVSNDLFYFNHVPLRLGENFAVTAPDGQTIQPENLSQGKLRTVFDLNLTQTGTYRLAMVNQGVRASWKEGTETRRFRGSAALFAKEVPADAEALQVSENATRLETFVTVGKPSPLPPSGKGLELITVTHPNDLYAGESATFALHLDGQPASQVNITIIRGGTRYRNHLDEIKLTTNQQGQFTVTWPQAGMYWLEAEAQDAKTTLKQASVRNLSYVTTLEVLPQ